MSGNIHDLFRKDSFHLSVQKFIILSFVLIFFLAATSYSQHISDTFLIREVTIVEKGLTDITGLRYFHIDSGKLSENSSGTLSGILLEHTSLSVKSYGSGGITTASFRGAGPSHTQVLWNGIDINSPMLGQVDFSLMPNIFLDEVTIYNGGCALTNN